MKKARLVPGFVQIRTLSLLVTASVSTDGGFSVLANPYLIGINTERSSRFTFSTSDPEPVAAA